MNKAAAKRWVYETTVTSLRKYTKRLTSGEISMKATQKDVTKVKAEMDALADYLEKKLQGRKSNDKADVGGESQSEEAEVSAVREPQA